MKKKGNNIYPPIKLIIPKADSKILEWSFELEALRNRDIVYNMSAHGALFIEIKMLFQKLESIASARMEGNRTTVQEYMELKDKAIAHKEPTEKQREIDNVYQAIQHIERAKDLVINRKLISELHEIVVKGLKTDKGFEGDKTPGEYRLKQNWVGDHTPPEATQVPPLMDELIEFISRVDSKQFHVLKIALAHHRFVWIHPFYNGNGRMVRLLTYAMFMQYGYDVGGALGLINPASIFCLNRKDYNSLLRKADSLKDKDLLAWSVYAIGATVDEVKKLKKLGDQEYLYSKILIPALDYCLDRKILTNDEYKILKVVCEKGSIRKEDIESIFSVSDTQLSRKLMDLKQKKVLWTMKNRGRDYYISLQNNFLWRGIINALIDEGFHSVSNLDAI